MRRDDVSLLSDNSSDSDVHVINTRNTSTTVSSAFNRRSNSSSSSYTRRSRRSRNMTDTKLLLPIKLTVIEAILLYCFGFGFEAGFRLRGPPDRGFFCNDLTIRLHKEEEIVPLSFLVLFIYSCCFVPVIFVELYRLIKYDPENFYSQYEKLRTKAERLIIRIIIFCGWFHVALMTTWAITATAKFSIGRLRPYFVEACKPDVDVHNCFDTDLYFSPDDYNCTGSNTGLINEAHLSFFSGHSSLSMCSAVFSALYLYSRLYGKVSSRIATILIQVSIIATALFISFSRVVDHSHHPEDVVIGMIVGAFISIVVVTFCAHSFKQTDDNCNERKNMSNDSLVV